MVEIKVGLFRLNLKQSNFIRYTVVGPYVPTTVFFIKIKKYPSGPKGVRRIFSL